MAESSEGLEALVKSHSREVHSLLLAITRNAAIAEELAQEVFLLAFRKGVQPGPGMRAWLRETARNLAMNELRRKRPAAQALHDSQLAVPAADVPPEVPLEEELAALHKCLGELAEADRELLAARYERGEPLEKLAAALAQSAGYLKQRLFRLRRRLGQCVKRRLSEKEAGHA